MFYAIINSGGKQYKVEKGNVVKMEKVDGKAGDKVKFDIAMISDGGKVTSGNPLIKGAVCEAEVVEQGKGRKIVVYRYKAKKNVRKKRGHRQMFTAVKILDIKA